MRYYKNIQLHRYTILYIILFYIYISSIQYFMPVIICNKNVTNV